MLVLVQLQKLLVLFDVRDEQRIMRLLVWEGLLSFLVWEGRNNILEKYTQYTRTFLEISGNFNTTVDSRGFHHH